jgi:hypothetical protein
MTRERNFRAFGGVTWFPYQFALGFSLRVGEFRGVRLYLGPLKFWVSVQAEPPALVASNPEEQR